MKIKTIIITSIISILVLIVATMFCFPIYRVWQQELAGKAMLMRATQERLIQVEQAKAEREAAVERAEAIRIIGDAAQKYPEYRLQEFMGAFAEALQSDKIEQMIYVPTEANIPVTEATRLIQE